MNAALGGVIAFLQPLEAAAIDFRDLAAGFLKRWALDVVRRSCSF